MLKIPRRKVYVENLNTRPEKHGEESVPAADLKLAFTGAAKTFLPMLLPGASKDSIAAFWNDDGSVRFPQLGVLPITGKKKGCDLTLIEEEFEEKIETKLPDGDVKGIKFEVLNDHQMRVTLTFQCEPQDNDWVRLAHLMQNECFFTLYEKQRSLLDSEEEEEGEAA